MNRRDALRRLAAGGAGAAASLLWVDTLTALAREQAAHLHAASQGAAAAWAPKVLNPHQFETVTALSELIIPATETPGAKGALVHRFIDELLVAAPRPERDKFLAGLAWLDARSTTLFKNKFVAATPEQQAELLTKLSAERGTEAATGVAFFTAIKSMTITGYYTSEIGLRQELGDDGQMVLPAFAGCTHPEHQG